MAYFENFPVIEYDFTTKLDDNEKIENIIDISTKINMTISDSDKEKLCVRYTIKNSDLPEHVSQEFYQTNDLAWTILFINNIGDIDSYWPMSDFELRKYCEDKYGVNHINDIRHYEKLPEEVIMDRQFILDNYPVESLNTVTNYDYENILNEEKRYIFVIKQEYIGAFVTDYMAKLS